MRRRALLAASQPSGGGEGIETWLQFPLYFDFDRCEIGLSTYCTRDADDTSIELANYLRALGREYGEYFDDAIIAYSVLSESVLDDFGITIYFKGLKVKEFICFYDDSSASTLKLDGEYEFDTLFGKEYANFVYLRNVGEIFIEM